VQIGCDEHNDPVIAAAPDGVPCVQVTTAEVHQRCTNGGLPPIGGGRWWAASCRRSCRPAQTSFDLLVGGYGERVRHCRTTRDIAELSSVTPLLVHATRRVFGDRV
jgi:hypothetical protein